MKETDTLAWTFHFKDGWREKADPILIAWVEGKEFGDALEAAGFYPKAVLSLYTDKLAALTIYRTRQAPFVYYLDLTWKQSSYESLYCEGLPSLLMLLKDLTAICRAVNESDELEDAGAYYKP